MCTIPSGDENSREFFPCSRCRRTRFEESLASSKVPVDNNSMSNHGLQQENLSEDQLVVPAFALREYFTQEFKLAVPPWQREYSWDSTSDEGQVGVLLEDLKEFVQANDRSEYLLGAVILCNTDKPDVAYLIDGQQRTVTLTLFLMCCEQYISEKRLVQDDFHFRSLLNSCIGNLENGYFPTVEFSQDNANSIMKKVFDWMRSVSDDRDKILAETDTYSATQKNLLSAVKYISSELRDGKWLPHDQFVEGVQKILSKVRIVQLRLGNEKEAQRAFDRINHRGMALSGADLIKNILFEKVDENDFELISESWTNMSQTLRQCKNTKLQDPKYLIRAHAWTTWEKKTTYDDLTDSYKRKYLNDSEEKNPRAFALELEEMALTLKDFSNDLSHRGTPLPLLLPAQFLGSVQHYPVLLAGRNLATKNREAFFSLYHQVSMRTAWYVLAKERPPEFESIIPKWANAIRKEKDNMTLERLEEIYRELAFGDPAEHRFERMKSDLELRLKAWKYNESEGKKKIRAALALMSWWTDQFLEREYPINSYFDTRKMRKQKGWDLDHIVATKYVDDSVSPEMRNSIGNIALLCPDDHRPTGAMSPKEKIPVYQNSHLLFSKLLVGDQLVRTDRMNKAWQQVTDLTGVTPEWSLNSFGSKQIHDRTDFLLNYLTKILTLEAKLPHDI